MRYKVLEYIPVEDFSLCSLTIATPYGNFDTFLTTEEQDMDIANYWTGLEIGTHKALIRAEKEKAKQLSQRAIGAQDLLNQLENIGAIEEGHAIYHHVEVMKRVAKNAKNHYKKLEKEYPEWVASYLNERRKYLAMADECLERVRKRETKCDNE